MARFIDHHPMPSITPEQGKAMAGQIKSVIGSKKANNFGMTALNVFMAPGESWCYNEAPNAEAVIKGHEAIMGIKLTTKDVTQVTPVV